MTLNKFVNSACIFIKYLQPQTSYGPQAGIPQVIVPQMTGIPQVIVPQMTGILNLVFLR